MALFEQTLYDKRNGRCITDNLADYLVDEGIIGEAGSTERGQIAPADPVLSTRDKSNPRRAEIPAGRLPYAGLRT